MKNAPVFAIVLILMALAAGACDSAAPSTSIPHVETGPSLEAATAPATSTSIPVATLPATAAPLELEIVQSQVWTDRDGNARVNVLMRNPYDFPVAPSFRSQAELINSAGKMARFQDLYFLDGISGGGGYLMPGETIAANACFTCEQAPLSETWDSVKFKSVIQDASERWNVATEVTAEIDSVSFDGDSPIFWITGTVKNNSDSMLSRISTRVFVFDQDHNLMGAAEAAAYDVGPGATGSFNGYGIGQAPEGGYQTEMTVLGVKY